LKTWVERQKVLAAPQLSIILSTYNRRDILLKTLEGYQHQTVDPGVVELLLVDDGSTDGTGAAVAEFATKSSIKIRCFSQQNRGLGAGRNYGLREAMGSIIFFTDDDIIPAPNLLEEHLAWHRKFPKENLAMVGEVIWSPDLHPTPFMEWLGSYGPLYDFASLVPGQQASFEHFYTCNVSAKREFIVRSGGFTETFGGSGYEDTEFSYRLMNKGMRITYNPAASGCHNKSMSYAEACRRQEVVFASWSHFEPTEAGQFLKSRIAQEKPPTLKRRLMLGAARISGPLLSPLTLLFDTQVRLPRIVYSLIYNFYVAPKAKSNFERRNVQNKSARTG
jgi:glycosyltransferase involved in cell wall biosynthesis